MKKDFLSNVFNVHFLSIYLLELNNQAVKKMCDEHKSRAAIWNKQAAREAFLAYKLNIKPDMSPNFIEISQDSSLVHESRSSLLIGCFKPYD